MDLDIDTHTYTDIHVHIHLDVSVCLPPTSRLTRMRLCLFVSVCVCLCLSVCAHAHYPPHRRRVLRLDVDYFDHCPPPSPTAATPPHTPPRTPTLCGAAERGAGGGLGCGHDGAHSSCLRHVKEGVIVVLKCRATAADADVADAYNASAPSGVRDHDDAVCGNSFFSLLLGFAGPRGIFGYAGCLLWGLGRGGRSPWTGRKWGLSGNWNNLNLVGECVAGESRSWLRRLALRSFACSEQVLCPLVFADVCCCCCHLLFSLVWDCV